MIVSLPTKMELFVGIDYEEAEEAKEALEEDSLRY